MIGENIDRDIYVRPGPTDMRKQINGLSPVVGKFDGVNVLGYNGKVFDTATGLNNYGYRDYMPGHGNFTTNDPKMTQTLLNPTSIYDYDLQDAE